VTRRSIAACRRGEGGPAALITNLRACPGSGAMAGFGELVPAAFDIGRDPSDEHAQRRIALNQATLRRLNEAMRAPAGRPLAFRCECGQIGCNQLIGLSSGEYETVRAHARRFAIVPGHEVEEVDQTVEHHEAYAVVEARPPVAAAVADETDPRASYH
jgi:hypothetical protein